MHNRQNFIGIGRSDRGRFFMSVTVFDAYVVSDLVKETVPTSTLPFSTRADFQKSGAIGGSLDCPLSHRSGGLSASVSAEIFHGTASEIKGAIHLV